jgi:hypothetical protein
MSAPKALCIGGPLDGQFIDFTVRGCTTLSVTSAIRASDLLDLTRGESKHGRSYKTTYRLIPQATPAGGQEGPRFFIWLEEHLTISDMVSRLIAGYEPKKIAPLEKIA